MKLTIEIAGETRADIIETLRVKADKLAETALDVLIAHPTADKTREFSKGIHVIATR